MPRILRLVLIVTVLGGGPLVNTTGAVEYDGVLRFGYRGGVGAAGDLTLVGLTPDLPLEIRFGLGYAGLDPGDPEEARKIFINNATNGTAEKAGRVWDYTFDFLVPLARTSPLQLWLATGPRHARFTGNFKYVGGNEDFDVTCNQWGWGLGLESRARMGSRTRLLLSAGVDTFFGATLTGHDTSYGPDGESVNQREEYEYDDADEAINQPKLRLRLMAGVGIDLN